MQKIKRKLYDKIIKSSLSRIEIHFLFYLAMRCDADGKVIGVYYHTLSEDLGCSIAKFYHLRDSLTKKGFIAWEKNNSADIDFLLIGNQFDKKIVKGKEIIVYHDYVDINISIFHDKEFFKCKAGAIQLAMYFINRVEAQGAVTEENSATRDAKKGELKRKLWYTPYKDYKDLAKMLNVSTRILRRYIDDEITKWITIGHNIIIDEKEKDIITVKRKALLRTTYNAKDDIEDENTDESNNAVRNKHRKEKVYPERYQYIHFVKTLCRRQGITYEKEDMLRNTADLILQYRSAASEKDRNIFNLITRAIQNSADIVLNSFNVHRALKNLLLYTGS